MLVDLVLAIIWLGISAYGIFGGADFGAGIWDLLAGGPARGERPRRLVERVIGPVWEANHVWLIFVLVYLWTAFPEPFVAIATTMYIPLTIAAIGIIFRGAGFAFRKWASSVARARMAGAAFAGSSLITPFFLGAVAGGIASGRVPLGFAAGDRWSAWLNPTSILGGVLAVLACAFVAAVLLTWEAYRDRDAEMVEYFRVRGLATGTLAGMVALGGVAVIRLDAPELFEGLTTPLGIAVVGLSAAGGIATLNALSRYRLAFGRMAAGVATIAVLWGWGVGQYPDLLPGAASVTDFAASPPVLRALIWAFVAAIAIAIPALVYLFTLTERGRLGESGAVATGSTQDLLDRLRE